MNGESGLKIKQNCIDHKNMHATYSNSICMYVAYPAKMCHQAWSCVIGPKYLGSFVLTSLRGGIKQKLLFFSDGKES